MRRILSIGLLAAMLYTGCGEKEAPQPTHPISQFNREPEKVVRDGLGTWMYHDFDGDGTWDAQEFSGLSTGAYEAQVTRDAIYRQLYRPNRIKVVDAIEEYVDVIKEYVDAIEE